jgi:DNA-binding CsgD family transcriptional regulator/PAS domain-containing protein
MQDHELLGIVGDIYDCVIEPKNWERALERISMRVGLRAAGIVLKDPSKRDFKMVHGWGGDAQWRALYRETYFALNPAMTAGWFTEIDEPVTCSGFAGKGEWLRCRMYREWMKPQGFLDAAGLNLVKDATCHAMLSVIRSEEQGWFTEQVLSDLRLLSPHVRRAVMIADLLDVRGLRHDALSATFDLLTVGVILVDDKSRICYANRAAMRKIDEKSAVRRSNEELSARDPKAAAHLKDAVSKAAQSSVYELAKTGIVVPIPGVGGRDLAAWVLPLDAGLRSRFGAPFSAIAAIFLRELGETSLLPGELFVKRYKITPAECRVLMAMMQGLGAREVADALGNSEPTVRTHIQHLLMKTNTANQVGLMRLAISAIPPASN